MELLPSAEPLSRKHYHPTVYKNRDPLANTRSIFFSSDDDVSMKRLEVTAHGFL